MSEESVSAFDKNRHLLLFILSIYLSIKLHWVGGSLPWWIVLWEQSEIIPLVLSLPTSGLYLLRVSLVTTRQTFTHSSLSSHRSLVVWGQMSRDLTFLNHVSCIQNDMTIKVSWNSYPYHPSLFDEYEPPNLLCPLCAELGIGILWVWELLREKERRFKTHLSGEKNLEYFVGRVLVLAAWRCGQSWEWAAEAGARSLSSRSLGPASVLSQAPVHRHQPQPLASLKTLLVSRDPGDPRPLIRLLAPLAPGPLTTDPGCHDVLVTTDNTRSRGQTRHWPPNDVVLPPVQVKPVNRPSQKDFSDCFHSYFLCALFLMRLVRESWESLWWYDVGCPLALAWGCPMLEDGQRWRVTWWDQGPARESADTTSDMWPHHAASSSIFDSFLWNMFFHSKVS